MGGSTSYKPRANVAGFIHKHVQPQVHIGYGQTLHGRARCRRHAAGEHVRMCVSTANTQPNGTRTHNMCAHSHNTRKCTLSRPLLGAIPWGQDAR